MELGFVFKAGNSPKRDTVRKSWDDRFQDLLVYKEQNGKCDLWIALPLLLKLWCNVVHLPDMND